MFNGRAASKPLTDKKVWDQGRTLRADAARAPPEP